jgi:hypothetical protein
MNRQLPAGAAAAVGKATGERAACPCVSDGPPGGLSDQATVRARPPGPSSGLSVVEWAVLFNAVQARIRSTVCETPSSLREPPSGEGIARMQEILLECVAALDQLRAMHP